MTTKSQGRGNQGIVGDVRADVVAVGLGAIAKKAVYVSTGGDEIRSALGELRNAIASLALPPHAQEALAGDLRKIEEAARVEEPSKDLIGALLDGLAGKLKMVGVVLSESVALAEPVRKLGTLLQIPLQALGLGV